ncbi:MAG: hypothetical protein U0P81_05560 [Holophagaceae bacterium]
MADGLRTAKQTGIQVWDEGKLYTLPEYKSGHVVCSSLVRGKISRIELRLPETHRFATVSKGVAYTWAKTKDGITFFQGFRFQEWTQIGSIPDPTLMISDFRPLSEDRLLVVRIAVPFVTPERASFFGVFKRDSSGNFRLEDCAQDGLPLFDARLRQQFPKGPPVRWVAEESQPIYVDCAGLKLVDTGGFPLAVLPRSGWIVVFHPETGRPRGSSQLYPSTRSPENKNKAKEVALLGWRPSKDGELLIAARTEDAILNSRDIFQDTSKLRTMDPAAYAKAMDRYFEASLEAFPDLRWFEFDPESRHFRPILAPRNQPERVLSGSALRGFQFWLDAKGNCTSSGEM